LLDARCWLLALRTTPAQQQAAVSSPLISASPNSEFPFHNSLKKNKVAPQKKFAIQGDISLY
jgi:hypothetical protein